MVTSDVLVVGSGPTGLVSALVLAQNGVSVRVIERLPHFAVGQRGAFIMPRTQEVYHFLGVLDSIQAIGEPVLDLMLYENGKPIGTRPSLMKLEGTPAYPLRCPWSLGQDAACGILREHLKKFGVEVELATELLSLDDQEDRVTAHVAIGSGAARRTEEIVAKFVIGADGAKGSIRKQIGMTFLGEKIDSVHLIVADMEIHGLNGENWHKFGEMPDEGCMLCPTDRFATERIFSSICYGFSLDHSRCIEDPDYLRQFVRTVTQVPGLEVGKIEYLADYRPNVRVVNSFQKGRVFIAGDAAHTHPISGGQGMNSSVMDAFNLGWKLALAAKGPASASLLDSYTAERLPVIKEMLQHTTAVARYDFEKVKKTPAESGWPRPIHLFQLGVNYRWSPIVVDEITESSGEQAGEEIVSAYVVKEGDRLHAGDRAPDAPGLLDIRSGETKRLFDLFRPTHHTVLVFSHSAEDLRPIIQLLKQYPTGSIYSVVIFGQVFLAAAEVQGTDVSLVDERGHAYGAYGAQTGPTSVAIVRPDGVVGALVKGLEGVQRYFSLVFAS